MDFIQFKSRVKYSMKEKKDSYCEVQKKIVNIFHGEGMIR